jgi:hypothetical protein
MPGIMLQAAEERLWKKEIFFGAGLIDCRRQGD